jgi:cell division protein FtsL
LLVASERFDTYSLPHEYGKRRLKSKRVRKISARTKVFYCVVVIITMALSFMLTSKSAQIASIGYEIAALKEQVRALDAENQALQNKVAELKSLERIEYVATAKLGMQRPEQAEGVQFVPVEYSKAGSGENVTALASGAEEEKQPQAGKKRNSLVQSLVQIING